MAVDIHFYTGKHCHLCDLADALLAQLPRGAVGEVNKVDIATDHQAYHLYAVRIPVLKREDNHNELGWPFTLEALEEFLS